MNADRLAIAEAPASEHGMTTTERVWAFVSAARGLCSHEDIGLALGISRAEVAGHLRRLKDMGYIRRRADLSGFHVIAPLLPLRGRVRDDLPPWDGRLPWD